ncbi:MAG: hypothetical protein EKK41_24125 [Hyphomicrobiales bacterium]|nr:MAG: hypothetical protein EKK41_24125 [Hyphomicrobiales bacterium]
MPICIYCLKTKSDDEFEPEHVLSRALCGTGVNWTLGSDVCLDCNGAFSKFEAHWFRQAFEALARNFQGPISRNDKERFDRLQPVEIDDLYIIMKGDLLVYEAGFSFPNEPHFRPQIIDTGHGAQAMVGRREDVKAFKKGLDALLQSRVVEIALPLWREVRPDWLIALVERHDETRSHRISGWRRQAKPSGICLRSYPPDSFLDQRDAGSARFTSRLALDHRGRLYLRSANIESAVRFLDLLLQPAADVPPARSVEPGDQTVAFSFELNLNYIYKAVLKTGLNLCCHLYGSEFARHECFQLLRDTLLNDKKDDDGRSLALRLCRMDADETADFPRSSSADEHRLMLDLTSDGILRFRVRLYNSFGYYAHLGPIPPDLRSTISTRRVVVDFTSSGMREVAQFP